MATYKVWLTVKDSYGNTKEIDGGTINVDLATLTPDEISQLGEHFATDHEVEQAVGQTVKYSGFKFKDTPAQEAGD